MNKKDDKKIPPLDKNEENTYVDDVFFEKDEESSEPGEKIKSLKEKLGKCLSERKEYLDGWQRTKADFLNFKKTEEKSKEDFIKFSKEGLVNELIPVLDSFLIAFSNKEAWEKADKNWRIGIEYIYSQLFNALKTSGLEEIIPNGKPFDPFKHDCAETIDVSDEKMDNIVIETLRNGYCLNGRVIRAAKVKIGKLQKDK